MILKAAKSKTVILLALLTAAAVAAAILGHQGLRQENRNRTIPEPPLLQENRELAGKGRLQAHANTRSNGADIEYKIHVARADAENLAEQIKHLAPKRGWLWVQSGRPHLVKLTIPEDSGEELELLVKDPAGWVRAQEQNPQSVRNRDGMEPVNVTLEIDPKFGYGTATMTAGILIAITGFILFAATVVTKVLEPDGEERKSRGRAQSPAPKRTKEKRWDTPNTSERRPEDFPTLGRSSPARSSSRSARTPGRSSRPPGTWD